MRRILCCFGAMGLLLCVSGTTVAEPQKRARRYKKSTDAPKVKVVRRGGITVYELPGEVIYGKYHRPQAVLMMDRHRDLFTWGTPKKELTNRILTPLRRRPF